MIYWVDGDHYVVPYWLITYEDGSTQTVYEQKLVLDAMGLPDWEKVEIKHGVRYRRPILGTEVSKP